MTANTPASAMAQPWNDQRLSPDERADLVLREMTENEKYAYLAAPMAIPYRGSPKPEGAIGSAAYYPAMPRLGIPALQQTDASLGVGNLHNVRPGDNATALPASMLLAATFDPDLARATGALVGREAHAKGFNVELAGGANLIREARCGRSFEYVSEDPLLTGVIAGNSVAGIQSEAVVSTVKHFVLNAQEYGRHAVSSDVDEAALRESDLLAFEIAIEAGQPGSVMTAYNRLNGTYCSENAFLLSRVLKGEWHYPGWVMSDWGGTHSTEEAFLAGLDVQSGANLDRAVWFGDRLRAAVAEGRVPRARIDEAVRRILRSLFAIGVVDKPARRGAPIDYSAHRLLAQREAELGIVLLKNEGELLPLAQGARRILLVGAHADVGVLGGGGSASVTPVGSLEVMENEATGVPYMRVYHPSSPLQAIRAEAVAESVEWIDGTDVDDAPRRAVGADVVVVFAEQWRAEAADVDDLVLPYGQDALIAAISAANPRTVVVLETGGPVLMPWIDKVPAVIEAFYPGSGGGEAIAGVLFGRVNPAGRLPVTFPASESQLPRLVLDKPTHDIADQSRVTANDKFGVSYDIEGSDVGYRWYARQGIVPLFPFGFGLSFTRFAFSDLAVLPGGEAVWLTVTNGGNRAGIATPQVYVSLAGTEGFVPRLAGFARVELVPGESRRVKIALEPRVLARFNVDRNEFRIGAGVYLVNAAVHAADDGLRGELILAERWLKA